MQQQQQHERQHVIVTINADALACMLLLLPLL
jgi:hypothetical protein